MTWVVKLVGLKAGGATKSCDFGQSRRAVCRLAAGYFGWWRGKCPDKQMMRFWPTKRAVFRCWVDVLWWMGGANASGLIFATVTWWSPALGWLVEGGFKPFWLEERNVWYDTLLSRGRSEHRDAPIFNKMANLLFSRINLTSQGNSARKVNCTGSLCHVVYLCHMQNMVHSYFISTPDKWTSWQLKHIRRRITLKLKLVTSRLGCDQKSLPKCRYQH